MSLVTERTVKRYYVNGKGYATKRMAYYQLAKRELLEEIEEEFGRFTQGDRQLPPEYQSAAWRAMTERYSRPDTCWTCKGSGTHPYGDVCACDGGIRSDVLLFDTDAWHADICKRALEIMAKEEASA